MTVVCVDVGTTMIKAVGYAEDGTELAVARRPTAVTRPAPGHAEQDMAEVWRAVVDAVREVLARTGTGADLLALTAQGDGSWLVDGDGAPTGPAILWNDGRAAAAVERWAASGVLEEAFRVNGSMHFAGLPNAILTWLSEHDPDRLARSAASLTCGGWIFSRLTGEIAVDGSDASAPFMDIAALRYSDDLLRLYGMEWARRLLPGLRGDDRRTAPLTPDAAAELGLPAGVPVVLAPYDIASTAIGAGAVDTGQACTILGTTLCTEMVVDGPRLAGEPSGLTVAMGLPGRYLRAFPTLAGGQVVDWACRILGLTAPADLAELAVRVPPGAGGLVFLPYLSPAGERAPFLDPRARGAFHGLTVDHEREHLARAVLEGLSLVVRDCLTAAETRPTELRVSGGGSASPIWLGMLADVTGVPVVRSADAESGARGAFIVGLLATGRARDARAAADAHIRPGDSYTPDAARAAHYAQAYEDFLAVRTATARAWPTLAAARARTAPGTPRPPDEDARPEDAGL
ncbi:FGGY-family carbohydrate kinase [Actinomadura madurae]|uniref:FGGY-family carbohydrate kinase n=1 Tax=Actinomadura madurae TaxID=1993 RepID=UPI000D9F5795|nr:FGGY-family carbohydrate kinase [Actinomadura madurae]SPT58204.1 L-xylulose/3-keto-L-gulonate kinase [Actinomadura madurae]